MVPTRSRPASTALRSEDLRSRFITELGFKTPKKVDKLSGKEFYMEFSGEQFG